MYNGEKQFDPKKDLKSEGEGLVSSYSWFNDPKVMQSFVDACSELVDSGELSLSNNSELQILGIGSGTGVLEQKTEAMLKEKGFKTELWISDVIQEVVGQAIDKNPDSEANFLPQDNKGMPFADHAMDLVLARSVTHYEETLEQERQALSEVNRVLRMGGYFIDQAPTFSTKSEAELLKRIHDLLPKRMNAQTSHEVEAMLQDFFEVRSARSEHQAEALLTSREMFMKRYDKTNLAEVDSLSQAIVGEINSVPEEERPNVWCDPETLDFGWRVPFTTYICRKTRDAVKDQPNE